jgi:hypothetical protein
VCILGLVIQQAKASAMLSSGASPALSNYSKLSHKYHDLREKVIVHETRVLLFSITFV